MSQPRRVFLFEYLTSGAWPEAELNSSLEAEGRAMLLALAEDCLRLPACEVTVQRDARGSMFPNLGPHFHVRTVSDSTEEKASFKNACEWSDYAVIIAPEFNGLLETRVRSARQLTTVINAVPDAIALCADKLQLAEFCQQRQLSTIPTTEFKPQHPEFHWPFPLVIKPRDGAGSQLTFRLQDAVEADRAVAQIKQASTSFDFIQQPFIAGLAASISAIISADGRIHLLPAGEQILSHDGHFQYLGSDNPGRITNEMQGAAERVVRQCLAELPGLRGFIGFDLIFPTQEPRLDLEDGVALDGNAAFREPLLCEINPRLTTSYLALRQRCSDNLAACLLDADAEPLTWNANPVSYRVGTGR